MTRVCTVARAAQRARLRPRQPRPRILGHPLRGLCCRRLRGPSPGASSSCRATSRRASSRAAPRKPARLCTGRRPHLAARPDHPSFRCTRGRRRNGRARIGSGHGGHASVVRPLGGRRGFGRGTAIGAPTRRRFCAEAGAEHREEHPLVGCHAPRAMEALPHLDGAPGASHTGAFGPGTVPPRRGGGTEFARRAVASRSSLPAALRVVFAASRGRRVCRSIGTAEDGVASRGVIPHRRPKAGLLDGAQRVLPRDERSAEHSVGRRSAGPTESTD